MGFSSAVTATVHYYVIERASFATNAGVFRVKGNGKQRRNSDAGIQLGSHLVVSMFFLCAA